MKGVESSLLPKKEIVEGKIILALLFFCSFYFVGLGPFCWQVHKENKIVTSNVIIGWPCPLRVLAGAADPGGLGGGQTPPRIVDL